MNSRNKLLVFDFGNVLIDLNYPRHFELFRELFSDWPEGKYHPAVREVIHRYERGEISDDRFIWQFQQLDGTVNPAKIVAAWLGLLGEIPMKRLAMLKMLRQDYTVALLSNINSLHLRFIHRLLLDKYGIENFEDEYFDYYFYSHEIRMRKPEERMYTFVEKQTGFSGDDILFIDDRQDNIDMAYLRQWNVRLHDPQLEISKEIESYLSSTDAHT